MYATYTYAASSTAANILADVVKILTGETNKANLSANCVQAQTSISTAVSTAGWAVYDAAAGTNAQCLRAAYDDDASNYKYVVVDTNTAGYILLKGYESWNSGTHAGTNLCYNSDSTSYCQRISTANGGVLNIHANAASILMLSWQSGVWGSSTYACPTAIFERTRLALWDTVANNLCPLMIWANLNCLNATALVSSPRYPGTWGVPVTTSSAILNMCSIAGQGTSGSGMPILKVMYGANQEFQYMIASLSVTNIANNFVGGNISTLADCYAVAYNIGGFGDHLTYDGDDYIIWPCGNSRLAVIFG